MIHGIFCGFKLKIARVQRPPVGPPPSSPVSQQENFLVTAFAWTLILRTREMRSVANETSTTIQTTDQEGA